MEIAEILEKVHEIAVVGFSGKPDRAGAYVPAYMREHGYNMTGVTPADIAGPVKTYRALRDIPHPIDMVVLFRRSEDIPGHLEDILAVHPKVVWMQLGIRNEAVARTLREQGIEVVQDRCLMVDHRNLKG